MDSRLRGNDSEGIKFHLDPASCNDCKMPLACTGDLSISSQCIICVILGLMVRTVFCLSLLAWRVVILLRPRRSKDLMGSIGQANFVHPIKKNSVSPAQCWQKQDYNWRRIFFVSAIIGRNGLGLCRSEKRRRRKTPSGIYPIGPAFGYASSIATGLALPPGHGE